MTTLKAEKRDPQVKAKKLRREGFVTGVLYGKEMKENVALKFEEKEALRFMKDAKEGAQAALDIEGETVNAMVKNIDYDPMSKKYWLWISRHWLPVKSYPLPFLFIFSMKKSSRVSLNRNFPRFTTKQTLLIFWTQLRSTWQNCLQVQRICM